jgi:hypothetical protein
MALYSTRNSARQCATASIGLQRASLSQSADFSQDFYPSRPLTNYYTAPWACFVGKRNELALTYRMGAK